MSNRMIPCYLVCVLLAFDAANAQPSSNVAAPPATTLALGEYVTEGGWGQLNITRDNHGLSFSILAVGANVHTCDLEGQLRDGRATLDGISSEMPCVISMMANAKGIDVRTIGEGSCRDYCGMRAAFTGFYVRPPAQCKSGTVSKPARHSRSIMTPGNSPKRGARSSPYCPTARNFCTGWSPGEFVTIWP